MKKILLISFLVLVFPVLAFADGGMLIWPPNIYIDQSAQNAIVGWNGEEEIIILSIDLESSASSTVLRIIPLPAEPSEIKEGSFESFDNLADIINEKLGRGDWKHTGEQGTMAPENEDGVEIVFQEQIGAHDITVAKVNDLDYFLTWVQDFAESKGFGQKEVSPEFRDGVENYLKKDIKYFVFDVIETGNEKESVNPLVYRFKSDYLYYPILISGVSEIKESSTRLNLFLVTESEINLDSFPYSYYSEAWFEDYTIELTEYELEQVSEDVADLFDQNVRITQAYVYSRLSDLTNDMILFPSHLWDRDLSVGSRGKEVKALQQVLINDGFWRSEYEATGYFGPSTRQALIRFQEEYRWDILEPVGLEKGTGYFGPQTQDYFKNISLPVAKKQEETSFNRNLGLGMSGDDVKALQEILINEGVWESEVDATGYFGSITKSAVIKYQEKYAAEILEPLGLTNGTGFVGSSTRAHLNK